MSCDVRRHEAITRLRGRWPAKRLCKEELQANGGYGGIR
jgi:hypothetical protein